MLYARRMFKLTLLVSKGSCYVIAAVCSLLIFSNVVFPLRRFVVDKFPRFANSDILIVSVIFLVATVCIYQALKHLLDFYSRGTDTIGNIKRIQRRSFPKSEY